MLRVALTLLLLATPIAASDDLPPGALARISENRFRAGGEIDHLALSPDGKQVATVSWFSKGRQLVVVWDVETGRTVREYQVNRSLFMGFVWGEKGAFAVTIRAKPATKDKRAKVFMNDFQVWDFTTATPPLLPQLTLGTRPGDVLDADVEGNGAYYHFRFSADGKRVAAMWITDEGKHVIHVFELKPADTATKLNRVGTLDLGAEGADNLCISADGMTLVTFRTVANSNNMTATTWNVATGKPAQQVLVPYANSPLLTPDAAKLIAFVEGDGAEWGFDRYELANGRDSPIVRWKHKPDEGTRVSSLLGGTVTLSGRELVATVRGQDRRTHVIDLKTGKARGRFGGHAEVFDITLHTAVSADGSRIATADGNGLLRVWDAKTLRPLHEAPGHRANIHRVQFSPDGKRLLTWTWERTARLWDIGTGKELRAFADVDDDRLPVFTPDGTAIIYSNKKSLIARDLQTGLEVPLPKKAAELEPHEHCSGNTWLTAVSPLDGVAVEVYGSDGLRRNLRGHRGFHSVLGFTPDGTKLLTMGGDHTILVWDMRLAHVPLPDAVKNETDAGKLWKTLATGKADAAYLAMARLAREPDAAMKLLKMKLKPAAKDDQETDESCVTDARAIELLESLDTASARALLKELAAGRADAFRTQEAKHALERLEKVKNEK